MYKPRYGAWIFHDLSRRPELLGKVQRAADTCDDDYLEAVVKESMRLRPVINNVTRRLKQARHSGRLRPACRRRGVPVDRVGAPAAVGLSVTRRLPPGSVPWRQSAVRHVDSVRRRHPAARSGGGPATSP
jgi:hypothetical protein